jgi:hydrogenase expression/formation protein HypE
VVKPLFFPGGDIGSIAVNGTVNDLAMAGARPQYLSSAFIIEEGFPVADLERVVASMKAAADAAGVQLVTGDTKVVDKGKGDGLFINTAGVGIVEHALDINPAAVQPGDQLIVSGDLGRHGTAIMAQREGLQFETSIESDCAPVAGAVQALLDAGVQPSCLRDLTRGGLASALVEIAEASERNLHIQEKALPVIEPVRGACELLGLDPMYVANEGRFLAVVPADQAEAALEALRTAGAAAGPAAGQVPVLIGEVRTERPRLVSMESLIGADRVIDMLSGEQLPRIC